MERICENCKHFAHACKTDYCDIDEETVRPENAACAWFDLKEEPVHDRYYWHKCSEELPEPNVPVLVLANADTESFQFVGYYDDDDECWREDLDDQDILASIDYWTELPQSPKFG